MFRWTEPNLQARGMTLSTYSHSTPNLALTTDFLYALELPTHSPITPYSKFEPTHLAHASSGFKKIEVPYGMSPKEASGLFQIYARKGWLRRCEWHLPWVSGVGVG